MNLKVMRAEWRAVRRAALRLTHNSLSLVGLVSLAVVGVAVAHPEYAQAVGRLVVPAPEAPVARAAPVVPDPLEGAIAHPGGEAGRLLGLSLPRDVVDDTRAVVTTPVSIKAQDRTPVGREKREATGYLSKKYRVNGDAIALLVDAAYMTGKELSIDPLLLLSVMAVESGFNPFAESTAGASGLMQLMSKVHRDKLNDFGGRNIALNPVVNLRVGAVVLKDCIRRGGSIADGLRLYVGAGMGDDSGYGARVLQEKGRLAQAVRGMAPTERRVEPRRAAPRIEPIPSDTEKVMPAIHAAVPEGSRDDRRPSEAAHVEPKLDARGTEPAPEATQGRVASL